jgi:hypothetical protein
MVMRLLGPDLDPATLSHYPAGLPVIRRHCADCKVVLRRRSYDKAQPALAAALRQPLRSLVVAVASIAGAKSWSRREAASAGSFRCQERVADFGLPRLL